MTKHTQEELKEAFNYDPDTGLLKWKIKRGRSARGKEAGHVPSDGYRRVMLRGKLYQAHRLIWYLIHGDIPAGMTVDHINGDTLDNRICNLRLATISQNSCNRTAQENNKSGYKGVSKKSRGYTAQICVQGVRHYLGYYPTPERAHTAYVVASLRLHGEFAHA